MKIDYPHVFQTDIWVDFQKALGKQVFKASGAGWSFFAVKDTAEGSKGVMHRLYVPYGPTYNDDTSKIVVLAEIDKLAKEQKVDYIRIEPTKLGSAQDEAFDGYTKTARSFQPEYTNWVNTNRTADEILASFSQTNRTAWRNAEKRGQTFETVYTESEMGDFLTMMKLTAERTGAIFRDEKYLRTLVSVLGPRGSAAVIYVIFESVRVASALYVDDKTSGTRYYMFAGTADAARKIGANGNLVSYMILSAAQNGIKNVDLFGVSPPGAESSHKWYGFSAFKRSYGGNDVKFAGTWEKPVNKIRYNAMKFARSLVKKR